MTSLGGWGVGGGEGEDMCQNWTVVTIAQLCKYIKNPGTVYFNRVSAVVCEFHLRKWVSRKGTSSKKPSGIPLSGGGAPAGF